MNEAAALPVDVDVDVEYAFDDDDVPDRDSIRDWVVATLASAGRQDVGEVSVRVVDEAEGLGLNEQYRGKASATNVLSFPADDAVVPPGEHPPLGDIVICGPVVAREAAEAGRPAADHWAHMLVHGTLHLLGYDHENDRDAAEMESLETRILASGGIADPYAA